ncbi:Meiosis-specific serine/threonine-protein kinase mek1 [Serendipita sp. 405]|nr:Meiosis-specific serine/threonine-protein kinase mek1 [Serendipita sp. 405]
MAKYGSLGEGESRYIAFQLMKGLQYIHRLLISHRGKEGRCSNQRTNTLTQTSRYGAQNSVNEIVNLISQPENILLSTPGRFPRVVIADFGLAREQAYEPTANVAGTVSYLPPEAVDAITWKQKYSSESTDAWALGLIVFIMLK